MTAAIRRTAWPRRRKGRRPRPRGGRAASYPLVPGMRRRGDDAQPILNNTWRPTLSVIGAAGLPRPAEAGNVLAAWIGADAELPHAADRRLRRPPRARWPGCTARTCPTARRSSSAASWPRTAGTRRRCAWLAGALARADERVFGDRAAARAIGGSVPFMGLLSRLYPAAQIVITGALGADSTRTCPTDGCTSASPSRSPNPSPTCSTRTGGRLSRDGSAETPQRNQGRGAGDDAGDPGPGAGPRARVAVAAADAGGRRRGGGPAG